MDEILSLLHQNSISYELVQHPALYHMEEGLSLLQQVKHPGYYAKMAAAWALSEWYVKFPQAVGQLLAQQTLEPWVQNKAIQKVRESRRVSKAEKDALLRYKLQPTP